MYILKTSQFHCTGVHVSCHTTPLSLERRVSHQITIHGLGVGKCELIPAAASQFILEPS